MKKADKPADPNVVLCERLARILSFLEEKKMDPVVWVGDAGAHEKAQEVLRDAFSAIVTLRGQVWQQQHYAGYVAKEIDRLRQNLTEYTLPSIDINKVG